MQECSQSYELEEGWSSLYKKKTDYSEKKNHLKIT